MGIGTLIDIYIDYQGRPINIFEFPKDKKYYLLNESRREITSSPIQGRGIFSKLIELSSSKDKRKFSFRDHNFWHYLSENITAIDEDKMSIENLRGFRRR